MDEEKKRRGKKCLLLLAIAMFVVAGFLFFRLLENVFQKTNQDDTIEEMGTRYDNSIFYQYEGKIYASVPSGGLFLLPSADVESFKLVNPGEYLDHHVGKDEKAVYFGNIPIANLDAKKIKVLGNNYYSDGESNYYCSSLSRVNSEQSFWNKTLSPLFSGMKTQSHLYPYREISSQGELQEMEGLHAFAKDKEAVYYQGKKLEKASAATMREIPGKHYTKYFADGEHVYYQEKLLPLRDNKGLRTLLQKRGDVEYLFNPLQGELFIGEQYVKDSRPPYTILGENSSHVESFFWVSRDGVYYYDFQKKKERRAGDHIFRGVLEEIAPSVFTDDEDIYYLRSSEVRSKNRRTRNMLLSLETEIRHFDKKEGFEKVSETSKEEFGSLWKKGERYYYFDNLGPAQGIFDTIYEIPRQDNVKDVVNALGNSKKLETLIEERKLIPVEGEFLLQASIKINHLEVMLRRILYIGIAFVGILIKIYETKKKR